MIEAYSRSGFMPQDGRREEANHGNQQQALCSGVTISQRMISCHPKGAVDSSAREASRPGLHTLKRRGGPVSSRPRENDQDSALEQQVSHSQSVLEQMPPQLPMEELGPAVTPPQLPDETGPAVTLPQLPVETGPAVTPPQLPDETGPAVTPPQLPDETVPAVTPLQLSDETGPAVTPPQLPDETGPAVTPPQLPDETGPAATPPQLPDETGPAVTPPQLPDETGPAVTPPQLPDETGPAVTPPQLPDETVPAVMPPDLPQSPSPAQPDHHDHSYNVNPSKRHIHSPVKKLAGKCRKLRYENKLLRQKMKRRDRRLVCMKSTLEALKESRLVESELMEAIKSRFENPVVAELFSNEIINGSKRRGGQRYSEEIKKFCLTLHYYSPRAYKFLAKNFTLPGATSLRDWTRSVDCSVGVLHEVLRTLKSQVAAGAIDPNCCLTVDEMSIRKALVYSRRKGQYVGRADLGSGEVDESRLATNALVFMAVGLKGAWRHPVAYFLTDHVSGETLAQLATTVLCALSDADLRVRTLVADGLNANLVMFDWLGVKIKQTVRPPFSNYFLHPATREKVYVLIDVVHVLKLLRNLLGEYKTLRLDDEDISWSYIQVMII